MAQEVEPLNTFALSLQERTLGQRLTHAWRQWRRKPLGLVGLVIIVGVVLMAFTAPIIAPNPPGEFVGDRLEAPSWQFPLGTNNLGQDVLSRIIYGSQVSLAVGLSAAILATVTGTVLGIVSGYFGGWFDLVTQRVLEVLASFPGLVLTLIVVAVAGRPGDPGTSILSLVWGLKSLEMAIALVFIFGNVRVIRSAVLTERSLPYIEAAKSIGATDSRILARHIFPNVFNYVIISFSIIIGVVILIEAALSFLGYGVPSTTPSWGIDLGGRNREYFIEAPWLIAAPGIALSLTVLGFNFLGDALRDLLDPRLRGTR